MSIIAHGYCLPFQSTPVCISLNNNKSALKFKDFVEEAIEELLLTSRVVEKFNPPYVVNPLSVSVQANGKKRLILDLRHVNKYLTKRKVKYEDWKIALAYFQKDCYMISFDLKSGYHHVDIHEDHQCFLGFSWKFRNGVTRYFVFTVLPFGLSSAPHIFTKVLKPLEKYWRVFGFNIALFLDDGFLLDYTEGTCNLVAQKVKSDLRKSGFITNDVKSIWTPCQVIHWLGIVWDSRCATLSVSERRLQGILDAIGNIFERNCVVSARGLSSLVGKIISAQDIYGNLARIMTRYCTISIAAAQDWDSEFPLDDYCKKELVFWKSYAKQLNSRAINDEQAKKSNFIVYSDASASGCGAHLDLNGEQVCHKLWEVSEGEKSSTWRELSAIDYALKSFLPIIKSSYLKWFSDSQTAVRIIQVGSMKKELHDLAIKIFQCCAEYQISLDIQWIPRSDLERVDCISRIVDVDDWQITNLCFEYIEKLWGPHTVDCFANY